MATIGSDVQFRVSQTGAAEVAQSLEKINQTTDRAGKSTGGLSKFIREQRTEQRQQNFLFREGANVVGTLTFATIALTSATGEASKGAKQLNQSLVTGYSAFQAANFAMSGLGIATGGWGFAVQAAIGVGAAFFLMLKNGAQSAEEVKKQLDAMADSAKLFTEGIGKTQASAELEVFSKRLDENQKLLKELESQSGGALSTIQKLTEFGLNPLNPKNYNKELEEGIKLTQAAIVADRQRVNVLRDYIDALNQIEAVKKREAGAKSMGLFDKFGAGLTADPALLGTRDASGFFGRKKRDDLVPGVRVQDFEKIKGITDSTKILLKSIDEMDAKQMKVMKGQLEIVGGIQLGASLLSSSLDMIGVKSDSVIQKLLKGLQAALEIYQTIQTIGAIFKIGGAIATGGTSLYSGAVPMPKAVGGGPGIKGGGINITVNAVDAHSIRRMMSDPANASAFASSLAGRQRLGKSSPF